MDIIVCKYKENIDWLEKIQGKKIIYNKDDFGNGIFTKNIGREAYVYLKYIYDNYDCLGIHSCFLQGNPFDHCCNLEMCMRAYNGGFMPLANQFTSCDNIGRPHHYLKIGELSNLLFGVDFERYEFAMGAQFIVEKDIILKRSKLFYKHCLTLCEIDYNMPWVMERLWVKVFDENIKSNF